LEQPVSGERGLRLPGSKMIKQRPEQSTLQNEQTEYGGCRDRAEQCPFDYCLPLIQEHPEGLPSGGDMAEELGGALRVAMHTRVVMESKLWVKQPACGFRK
jgi:hypothetical protein